MSDVDEGDVDFYADQLLNKSKTHGLRERMRQFVSEHGEETDLRETRKTADGKPLSEIVTEEREERF
jgi:hypothetical protein